MEKHPDAFGENIWVIRSEPESERKGLILSDMAMQAKPNTGEIISIGEEIKSKVLKVGKKAIFSKQSGLPIEFNDVEYTVLRKDQILGCV